MKRFIALPLLAILCAPVAAQTALPPEPAVAEALDDHPTVRAAQSMVDAARAEARILKAGTQEFIFSGSMMRRSVDREGDYREFDATLSRQIRLPGKGRLEQEAGKLGIEVAENRAEDARHQAAVQLNDLWWDWVAACAQAAVDDQSVTNYEATLAAISRRVALRDAAQLDADQALAALGDARSMAAQSRGKADVARARLAASFPSLPLPPAAPAADAPAPPADGLDTMGQQVISRSHEIGAADAEASRMDSLAERARREKLADPSIGVRLFSERSGMERGAGVVFSMPIGGTARSASADLASYKAQAASSEAALVRREVQQMADGDVAGARAALGTWQRTREALEAQVAALQKLRRGQQLGASDLAEVLQAERLAHAAFRAEALARAEAHRAINRLRIDSHNLWVSE